MDRISDNRHAPGIFGGTFNPLHFGHLRAAEEIREQFLLAKVVFVPARIPPHKKAPAASAEQRYKMVELAIADNPAFELSHVELDRPGSSYAVETIRFFLDACPDGIKPYFIMGADAFQDIASWKEYPDFFSLCHFIIMSRPGHGTDTSELPPDLRDVFMPGEQKHVYRHRSGTLLCFSSITALDISSSRIRHMVRDGRNIRYLVPEPVERYVREQGLYAKQ